MRYESSEIRLPKLYNFDPFFQINHLIKYERFLVKLWRGLYELW